MSAAEQAVGDDSGTLDEKRDKEEEEKESEEVEKEGEEEEKEGEEEENKDEEEENKDEEEENEDEEEDNIKVTIEDYDFKATIQKQAQPAKQAAPLVLETNQEPIDINQLDEKPWRKPGADINDYFNYGFDETTWRLYCDKQNQMRQIVNEIIEPEETFKIPVVHAAPMVQQNVMPYIDERLTNVVMDSRNAPLAQSVPMQLHHQHPHQHHNQSHHQHQPAGGSGRMKVVEDDVKKYERRHERSSERRHSSKSRERRHSKSREREKDKDRERKRSRSRERRSKEARSRPRSRSREEERKSKRHKSSRHV